MRRAAPAAGAAQQAAHCCIVVLCGIPGSGKTTLAHRIREHCSSTVSVHLFSMDSLLLAQAAAAGDADDSCASPAFSPAVWQVGF